MAFWDDSTTVNTPSNLQDEKNGDLKQSLMSASGNDDLIDYGTLISRPVFNQTCIILQQYVMNKLITTNNWDSTSLTAEQNQTLTQTADEFVQNNYNVRTFWKARDIAAQLKDEDNPITLEDVLKQYRKYQINICLQQFNKQYPGLALVGEELPTVSNAGYSNTAYYTIQLDDLFNNDENIVKLVYALHHINRLQRRKNCRLFTLIILIALLVMGFVELGYVVDDYAGQDATLNDWRPGLTFVVVLSGLLSVCCARWSWLEITDRYCLPTSPEAISNCLMVTGVKAATYKNNPPPTVQAIQDFIRQHRNILEIPSGSTLYDDYHHIAERQCSTTSSNNSAFKAQVEIVAT